MKKRFKSIQIPLVTAICLFVLALPGYLRSTNLSETKFVSSDLFFENPDQENGLPDSGENALKVFGQTAFFTMFLLGANLSEQSSYLFSQAFSLHQKTLVLRC
jgi:hypothetical protein